MISHQNLVCECHTVDGIPGADPPHEWNEGKQNTLVLFLPAFHVAGYINIVGGALRGFKVIFALKNPVDLPMVVRAIKENRPHVSAMVRGVILLG